MKISRNMKKNCRDEQTGHAPLAGIGGEEEGQVAAEGNGLHYLAPDKIISNGREVIIRVGVAFCYYLVGGEVIADDAVRHIGNASAVARAEGDDIPLPQGFRLYRAVIDKATHFDGRLHARADDGRAVQPEKPRQRERKIKQDNDDQQQR